MSPSICKQGKYMQSMESKAARLELRYWIGKYCQAGFFLKHEKSNLIGDEADGVEGSRSEANRISKKYFSRIGLKISFFILVLF